MAEIYHQPPSVVAQWPLSDIILTIQYQEYKEQSDTMSPEQLSQYALAKQVERGDGTASVQ